MSNELNQYSCHRIYMIKIQKDIAKFVRLDSRLGVYAFSTGGVRKWIIGKKVLHLNIKAF